MIKLASNVNSHKFTSEYLVFSGNTIQTEINNEKW
jgi:hypothetical protein